MNFQGWEFNSQTSEVQEYNSCTNAADNSCTNAADNSCTNTADNSCTNTADNSCTNTIIGFRD